MVTGAALLRLPQVLSRVQCKRSTWLNGVRSGRFPKPVKNGRCTFWLSSDIDSLIEQICKDSGK